VVLQPYHLANSLGLCALHCTILPCPTAMMSDKYLLPYLKKQFIHAICFGWPDDVIKAKDNLNFLAQNSNPQTDYDITIKGWRIKFLLIFSNKKQKPFFLSSYVIK
jgi:hypothetical protein